MARTASLPPNPEDKVPPNPQSVTNSTRKFNKEDESSSKAQSSFDSQKTRATARSKLMEEAKWKGDLLNYTHNLNPRSRNSRRRSANTTKASSTIGRACLDKCTDWAPLLRNQLNLNLPRESGMFQVVLRMIFLTQSTAMDLLNELFDNFSMLTRQLLNDLLAPSEFA